MEEITLSYVTTTKNKLPYLKDRMTKLIAQRKEDEEILVADGASTDGTVEYLKGLYQSGKIQFFLSEPDFGESHALNKLFLQARGTLVKIITDDDIFHYPSIDSCKQFMLKYSEIDILSSEGGSFNKTAGSLAIEPKHLVRALDYEEDYRQWQNDRTPFSFCGLGIMFRRTSLPVLGLWDLSFRAADAEFSFRVTAGKAKVAWYTGYTFINVSNPQSVTLSFSKKIKGEKERLNKFYLDQNPDSSIVRMMTLVKNKFRKRDDLTAQDDNARKSFEERWPEISQVGEKWLDEKNQKKTQKSTKFLLPFIPFTPEEDPLKKSN